MPNINLIAQKRQEKSRLERNIRRLFFLMSSLFIFAIALFTVLSAQWFSVKGEVNALEDELVKLQPKVDKIKQFEARTKALAPKINLYGQARDHTLNWYTYLQVVARSLPDNTWLTRINTHVATVSVSSGQTSGPPPNAKVDLTGVTMNQQLVGEAMMSLNRFSDMMDTVELHFTRPGTLGSIPTIEFEVATSLRNVPAVFDGKPLARASSSKGDANATDAKS